MMEDYRLLTNEEILILEEHGCTAEDWTAIEVGEDFNAAALRNVAFYGTVRMGCFVKRMEISKGFVKPCGIRNATLRNVTIGDNCLIENVGGYINDYTIGDDCPI